MIRFAMWKLKFFTVECARWVEEGNHLTWRHKQLWAFKWKFPSSFRCCKVKVFRLIKQHQRWTFPSYKLHSMPFNVKFSRLPFKYQQKLPLGMNKVEELSTFSLLNCELSQTSSTKPLNFLFQFWNSKLYLWIDWLLHSLKHQKLSSYFYFSSKLCFSIFRSLSFN